MDEKGWKLVEVCEQNAVFDGKPNFMPMNLVMNVLNHNAYGGTRQDAKDAADTGEMADPRLFTVRVKVEVIER